jgi:hypothetical protein
MPVPKTNYLHLENGRLTGETHLADVQQLFQTFAASPNKDRLAVHFHGGLVSYADGMGIAAKLIGKYADAGAYPVFFVWESGPLETIRNNIGEIAKEVFFRALLRLVLKFAKDKIAPDAGARALGVLGAPDAEVNRELNRLQKEKPEEPYDQVDVSAVPADATLTPEEERQFADMVRKDVALNGAVRSILDAEDHTRSIAAPPVAPTRISPHVLAEMRLESREPERALLLPARVVKGAVIILYRVIRRAATGRAHGVYCTVFEEILREFYAGDFVKLIWDMMKKDTADAFEPDPRIFGGTAFLSALQQHWAAGNKPRIILVGHSTGAVYICHLLRHANALPADMQFDVVFLAPACHFQLFADTLRRFASRIHGFRLFGMHDAVERGDHLLGEAYPRSLLYFVSGVLEQEADEPLVGMERYYSGTGPYDAGSFPEIAEVKRVLGGFRRALVWSESNEGPGLNSASKKHGDFDDDEPTVESVKNIISQGF